MKQKLHKVQQINSAQLASLHRTTAVAYAIQLCAVERDVTQIAKSAEAMHPELLQLLHSYEDLFAEPQGLPPRRACDHRIPLMAGAQPVNIRSYRHKPELKNEIDKQVAELLQSGVIQKSVSPFASPSIVVKKKDGTWCLCQDYRRLNSMTIVSKYPVPIIEEILDELAGSKWFSKLDLRVGYHQIRLAKEEEFKKAFHTHSGHFEYGVMPFGLAGAPGTFLGAMNNTLQPVLRKSAMVFFDDILVCSSSFQQHLIHLHEVFDLLRKDA